MVADVFRRLAPLVAVGLLAACGSGGSEEAAVTTSVVPIETTVAPATTGDDTGSAVVPADVPAALQFAAPLVGGGDIELTTLAGRPVLLWFWAPW